MEGKVKKQSVTQESNKSKAVREVVVGDKKTGIHRIHWKVIFIKEYR